MTSPAAILAEIKAIAPPGREPSGVVVDRLRDLSASLVTVSVHSHAEYRRYLGVADRGIQLPEQQVTDRLAGRTVLVTGASGCIGSALVQQLQRFHPAHLVTLDVAPAPPVSGIRHVQLDIRNRQALSDLVAEIRPDLVFHQAAQRDPGLAERAVHRTVTTNVLGTRNLVEACARAGTGRFVFASTGKALRPYTPDVYAASKRAAELIVTDAATRGTLPASAARFTHVVDNAIVLNRFRNWCRRGELLRVHDAEVAFYVQSARESAQLLLVAALSSDLSGLSLPAIRDLGWPVSLLDVAIGVLAELGVAPLYISGHDPGYEEQAYPGLYDPALAGEVSPLLNSFEAPGVLPAASPDVDLVVNRIRLPADARRMIDDLDLRCATGYETHQVRASFNRLTQALLDVTLDQISTDVLRRVAHLTRPHRQRLTPANRLIDDRILARIGDQATHRQDQQTTGGQTGSALDLAASSA